MVGATTGDLAEARGYLAILERRISPERRLSASGRGDRTTRSAGPSTLLLSCSAPRLPISQFGESGKAFVSECLAVAQATNDAELSAKRWSCRSSSRTRRQRRRGVPAAPRRGLVVSQRNDARRSRRAARVGVELATYRGDLPGGLLRTRRSRPRRIDGRSVARCLDQLRPSI